MAPQTAERVRASDGESRRSAGLAMPMAELRDEYRLATRVSRSQRSADRDRPEMPGHRPRSRHDRRFARQQSRTDIAARAGFCRSPGAGAGWRGCNTADDKGGLVRGRGRRHAETDARHHRLEGKRIGDVNGQHAAAGSPSDELSQAFHPRQGSTDPMGWRPIDGGMDRHRPAVTLFTAKALPGTKICA